MGWPGEKSLIKLGDLVSAGTGGALAPWQTRRKGKAQADAMRDEMLMLAQTEKDAEDIKAGKKKYSDEHQLLAVSTGNQPIDAMPLVQMQEGRVEPYFNIEALDQQAQIRKRVQAVQEEINLTKTILLAEDELVTGNYEANDEPVDPDWFIRWRDNAEKVGNEELQRLWARALAGEVASPGSYSLRTLDFLKNLSQKDAQEIEKLAPYVIDNKIHKCPCLEEKGLGFSYLLEMEELGLLNGVNGGLTYQMGSVKKNSFANHIQYGGKVLLLNKEGAEGQKINLTTYKVTKFGQEVLKLGVFPFDYDYLEQVGQEIKKQNVKVQLADIIGLISGVIHFKNVREL